MPGAVAILANVNGSGWAFAALALAALGAVVTAVVTSRMMLHDRQVTGHRKPVETSRAPRVGLGPTHHLPWINGDDDTVRVAAVHLFNRSSLDQRIWLDTKKSRISWPPGSRGARLENDEIVLPAGEGGNYVFPFISERWNDDGLSKKPVMIDGKQIMMPMKYQKWYFVRIYGRTKGNKKVRYRRFVRLYSYTTTKKIIEIANEPF